MRYREYFSIIRSYLKRRSRFVISANRARLLVWSYFHDTASLNPLKM